jgi:hypothetical protein
MKKFLIAHILATLLGIAMAAGGSPARAEWMVTNLHPANAPEGSALFDVADGQQVGVVLRNMAPEAALWSGSAGSYVNLNPPQSISHARGSSLGRQAGYVISTNTNLEQHATIWSGTSDSWIDINPEAASSSEIWDLMGPQQVGHAVINGTYHASLWENTAQSWVDLHPPGAVNSLVFALDGNQQVGQVTINGLGRASLWTGTAANWVDLTPPTTPNTFPIEVSVANAVHGGQQGGTVTFLVFDSSVDHAGYWSGTAESWVDLNPDPTNLFTESQVWGVFGGYQVGQADTQFNGDGSAHAAFWHGTPESWVDLESYLPANYFGSNAFAVWTDGVTIQVAGVAFNNTLNRSEAILWTNTVPEPASLLLLAVGVSAAALTTGAMAKRRRSLT